MLFPQAAAGRSFTASVSLSLVGFFVLGVSASFGQVPNTTVVPTIPFETDADYSNSGSALGVFRDIVGGANIARTDFAAADDYLRFTQASGASSANTLYDADNGGSGSNTFLNSVTRLDFRITSASDSIGLYARLPTSAAVGGYLALVNIDNSGVLDQIRLLNAPNVLDSTQTLGATQLDSVQPGTSVLSLNTFYTLQFTVANNAANSQATLKAEVFALGQSVNALLSSNTIVSSTYTGLGRMGILFGDGNASAASQTDADNFSVAVAAVVPEPASAAMILGGLGMLGLLRRRR